MTFNFEFADKSHMEDILPQCFGILRTNMELVTPNGKTYDEDFSQWYSAVFPAMSKENRQLVIITAEEEIIGFFMYYISEETFMMEEIQIKRKHQQSGIFGLLYKWLLPKLPETTKTVEAYAHKNNIKSQKILEHLGLICLDENGDCFYYKGNFKKLINKYLK